MKIKINYINEIIKTIFPQLEEENEKAIQLLFDELKNINEENDLIIKKEKEINNKIQIIWKLLINVDDVREKLPQISKNIIEVKMNIPFSEIKKILLKKIRYEWNK